MKHLLALLMVLVFASMALADTVTLTWTAPADDKGLSTEKAVTSYKLMMNTVPITDANFASGVIIATGVPKGIGQNETYTVEVPLDKHYYFAIKSYDAAGNESPLSNIPELDFFHPSQIANLSARL